VLTVLRAGGPQTAEEACSRLRGRMPRLATILAALDVLQDAGLAVQDQPGLWRAHARDDSNVLGELRVRGPHDLRHTFATWLEDAGIPARVIDELMGHAGGHRSGGAPARDGSPIGARYRWTTPEMEARVVAAIEQRLAASFAVAALVNRATQGGQLSWND